MRYVYTGLALVVVVGVLAGIKGTQIGSLIAMGKAMEAAGPPPETVSSATAEAAEWEVVLSAVGSVVSEKGVTLKAEVAGVLKRLPVASGVTVKAGQVIAELDTDVERAQLASLSARRELAAATLKRSESLLEGGGVSRAQFDVDSAELKGLLADEAALKAQIARKVIRAPFAGKVGLRLASIGQYLAVDTAVTTIESDDAIFIDFPLAQSALEHVALGQPVRIFPEGERGRARGEKPVEREAVPAVVEGAISAIEPRVDPRTRMVSVRATLPPEALGLHETSDAPAQVGLRPGMFAPVAVVLPETHRGVVVPVTALVRAPYGDSVFIIEEAKPKEDAASGEAGSGEAPRLVARQSFVRVREIRGDFAMVEEGVEAGATVVSVGAFKLSNGSPVVINNEVGSAPSLQPDVINR